MKTSVGIRLVVLGVGLVTALGCGHQSAIPVVTSGALAGSEGARLPFDQAAQRDGISPTSSVVPPGAQIPAGTPITIRLKTVLSSATAASDDVFEAVLDEPIMVNGQTVAEPGTKVTGRVVDAKAMTQAPGYLRLALSSLVIHGEAAAVRTSSKFLKGSGPVRRRATMPVEGNGALIGAVATSKGPLMGNAMVVADSSPMGVLGSLPRDVSLGQERRLTFRLIEPLPLRP
jgi:hypothetical protein